MFFEKDLHGQGSELTKRAPKKISSSANHWVGFRVDPINMFQAFFFYRDGIHADADYNFSRVCVGVVAVVIAADCHCYFHDGITRENLKLSS